jgi:host factor-I protein
MTSGRTLTARPRAKAAAASDAGESQSADAGVEPVAEAGEGAAVVAEQPVAAPAGAAPAVTAPMVSAPASKPASGNAGKGQNLQDQFLNHLRKNKTPVTMFLVKGVKLQGIVTWFDNFSILLRRDGQSQLVYKHAVSTIMPGQPIDTRLFNQGGEGGKKARLLQDVFLSSIRAAAVQVTMFLVNGVMLQGRVAAYDLFCMLLEREGYVQLAYKHAVSTIQPVTPVDLTGEWDGEEDA